MLSSVWASFAIPVSSAMYETRPPPSFASADVMFSTTANFCPFARRMVLGSLTVWKPETSWSLVKSATHLPLVGSLSLRSSSVTRNTRTWTVESATNVCTETAVRSSSPLAVKTLATSVPVSFVRSTNGICDSLMR